MIQLDTIVQILQTHGLLILFPVAILEGPIVTVIAAYFAQLGYMDIFAVYAVCVVADLVGDAALYGLGRRAPDRLSPRWRRRLGIDGDRLATLEAHFRQRGPSTLILGKLTHSVGFAVLLAAGASRMRFLTFLWYNLLATLPKTLFFLLIGYSVGAAYVSIDRYIFRASVVLLVLIVAAVVVWKVRRKWRAR